MGINLPDFGMPEARPEIPARLYAARVALLRERSEARRYDRLVVYADREHDEWNKTAGIIATTVRQGSPPR